MAFNVQGSITVKRLRSGSTITLYATTNNPLQQIVDADSGVPAPDWTVEANQPTITPHAVSSNGTVTMSDGEWYYNTVLLVFDGSKGTTSDGWTIDTTGKFAFDSETFALRIIDNLASKENYASDTLEFDVVCHFEGYEYAMSWTTEITILQGGTSAYTPMLWADTQTLTTAVTETTIHAQILAGSGYMEGFYVSWYKNYVSDDTLIQAMQPASGQTADLTVNRDDVNGGDNNDNTGGTLFVCQYFKEQTDTSPIAVAGINIADESDEFSLILSIVSSNKQLAENKPVTVQADVYSISEQGIVSDNTFKEITYTLSILGADLTPVYTVNEKTVEVSMEGGYELDDNDVNVVGEAEFTLNY